MDNKDIRTLKILEKVDDDNITIIMDGEEFEFPAGAVKRANLIYSG